MIADPVELTGLDGANPLGLLAALGALRTLDLRAKRTRTQAPRLAWVNRGAWRPLLFGPTSMDSLIDDLLDDVETWKNDPALALRYDDEGRLVAPDAEGTADLKPDPRFFRQFAQAIVEDAHHPMRRRSVEQVATYGSELVTDNNGRLKPTAFHFTAGQQLFLDMVLKIRDGIGRDDFTEALVGPWMRTSKLPSLSWDASATRTYALRATNPSHEKRGGVPAADWLGFVGLAMFLSTPFRGRLVTTGVRGRWKDSLFSWPIWTRPATAATVRSLLAWPDLPDARQSELAARGVALVFASAIGRSDQGGYGSFSPASVR